MTFNTKDKSAAKEILRSTICFSSLCDVVRDKFSEFEIAAFNMRWGDVNGGQIDNDNDVVVHLMYRPQEHPTVYVESDCKDFKKFTISEALSYAGASGQLPIVADGKFPPAKYDDDDEEIMPILDQAFREIMARIRCFGPFSRAQNETTVRELITPVLLAAAEITHGIRLVCEKTISGSKGAGPVDFAAVYKEFNAVITEARKDNVEDGLCQNIAQLVSSREDYLFNVAGVKRKFEEVASAPGFGALCTGEHWIFTKYEGNTVYRTKVFSVLDVLDRPKNDGADLRKSLYTVIKQVVGLLEAQKEAVDAYDISRSKEGRLSEGHTRSSSSSASASSST